MAITLKAARVNAGLIQREAAERLGIARETLRNYENGRTKPDIDMAIKISELYGLKVDDILFLPNDFA